MVARWIFVLTNYESRKSDELLTTGKAAFCIHWKSQRRQVRVVGAISKATAEQSDEYLAAVAVEARLVLGHLAQSRPLASRAVLEAEVARIEGQFPMLLHARHIGVGFV